MMGAHLEYIGPYHWRLTGLETVDIRRVEEIDSHMSIVNRWYVEPRCPETAGGSGVWGSAAHALSHAFSVATHAQDDGLALPVLKAIEKQEHKATLTELSSRFAR